METRSDCAAPRDEVGSPTGALEVLSNERVKASHPLGIEWISRVSIFDHLKARKA